MSVGVNCEWVFNNIKIVLNSKKVVAIWSEPFGAVTLGIKTRRVDWDVLSYFLLFIPDFNAKHTKRQRNKPLKITTNASTAIN